jgi:hypothetical protein
MTTMEDRFWKRFEPLKRNGLTRAECLMVIDFCEAECARAVEEAVVAERSRCIECAPKSTGYLFTAKSTYENAVADFIKAIKGE